MRQDWGPKGRERPESALSVHGGQALGGHPERWPLISQKERWYQEPV